MRPGWRAKLEGLAVLACCLAACGPGAETLPQHRGGRHSAADRSGVPHERAAESQGEPGPWLTVDEAEDQQLEGHRIYHQVRLDFPVLLRQVPVLVPLAPSEIRAQRILVHAVLTESGRVARAEVLRAPALAGITTQALEERIVEALRAYRFEPAKLEGRPVAVYYNLSLTLTSDRSGARS